VRLQSAFISENEVKKVSSFVAKNNEAELPIDIGGAAPGGSSTGSGSTSSGSDFGDEGDVDDDMYEAARQTVIETGRASTSFLQRKLGVGYSRAAKLMDMLEEHGVIGPANGSKPRDVLEKGSGGAPVGGMDGDQGEL
jgi:S-DNA-T family DNA segregation ATPase FtsK/SpoIIIE